MLFYLQIKPDFHSLIGQISQHSSWDVSMTSEEDGGRVRTVCDHVSYKEK